MSFDEISYVLSSKNAESMISDKTDPIKESSTNLNDYGTSWLGNLPVKSVYCANATTNIPPLTNYTDSAKGTLTVYKTSRGVIQEYKTIVSDNGWKTVKYTRILVDKTWFAWKLA